MKIVIIDGQGGRMGRSVIEQLKKSDPDLELYAIGTNSIATSAMIKAGASHAATGENPAIVNSQDADIIIGPIGIVIADSLLGEITPAMAAAVCQSRFQSTAAIITSLAAKTTPCPTISTWSARKWERK